MKLIAVIFVLLLTAIPVFGQARTAEQIARVPFSSLNTGNPPDGAVRYVFNGAEGTSPCTGGGTGALAIKVSGVWHCPSLSPGVGSGDMLGVSASSIGEMMLFSTTGGKNAGRSNTLSGIPFLSSGVVTTLASTGTGSVARETNATLNTPTLVTPTIASFNNAQHLHSAASGGGQLNASNVFSAGTIPPARVISGTITNARCLRVSNVGQIEVAASDCGAGGGGSPGGVSGNLTFNESGAFGGIVNSTYDSITGRLTFSQKADGSDTIYSQRFTNTSPTGSFLKFRDATGATDLFLVAASGAVTLSSTLTVKNSGAPSTPASGNTVLWTDTTDKNLKAQDDGGNVSITLRPVSCSGTDKISSISSAGVVTCTADQGGAGTGVITFNTLNTSDQTVATVDDTNIDVTWASSVSTHTLTVAWVGTLAKARQHAATAYTDAGNTFSTGAQSFAAATSLTVPTSAGAAPTASGQIAYDSTGNTLETGINGTNRIFAFTTGSQTFTDKTLDNSTTYAARDTLFTLQDNTDSTKTVNFELSGITTATNRVVSIANAASTTVQPTTATTNQWITHIDSAGVQQKAQPSFSNLSGTMGATQGGTDQTAVAQGDLLFGSATNIWSRLAKSTTATRYLANTGASNNPAWAQVDLTNGVTGILLATNGGTANGFFAVAGPTTSTKTFTFPNASATVLTDAAAVTIAQGGHGQTTAIAGFNALDPLTTKGDVLSHDGTNSIRVPVGTNGQGLVADSTVSAGVKWATFTAAAGGSTTQLQRNLSGALAGISGATSDGTSVTFTDGALILNGGDYGASDGSLPGSPVEKSFYLNTNTSSRRLFIYNNAAYREIFQSGLSGPISVPNGGTGLAVGASGGIPYFSSTTTMASSAALTANLPVIGGGAGVAPTVGTRSGNTTAFVTTTGTLTSGRCAEWDASGNLIQAVAGCGGGGGSGTVTVVSSGSLTSTALVTGGGTTTLQTPSATSTLDSSGNMSLPGSLSLTGSGAGYLELAEGTIPTAVANRVSVAAPTDVTAGGWVLSLPTTAGTNGQFLQTNGSGVTVWATPGGSGTVTATAGALTLNAVVLGAGTTDTKVSTGINTDGAARLDLGTSGALVGDIRFFNLTSGNIRIVPTTGALGTSVLTLPARSATVATTTGTLTSGRCVEIDASGNLIQAAAACGSGGGSGTINSGVTNIIPKYTASTTLDDSLLADDATTLTYTGSGGLSLVPGTPGTGVLSLADTNQSHFLRLTPGSNITADRTLTLTTGDADRTLTMGGAITTAHDLITSGAFSLTLTTTGTTNVTLPTSGTLATVAGNIGAGTATTPAADDNDTSIATTAYVQAELTAYASDTKTLTNTSFDSLGTGNTLSYYRELFLPAAGCDNGTTAASFWDSTATTPAVAACVIGTVLSKGVLDFADTSGGFARQTTIQLPFDFTGTIDAVITWTTTATSGNVEWSVSTICTAMDATEVDDPAAFNTASTIVTAAPGVANRIQNSIITSLTITGCAASELMHIRIFRDGNDAQDTLGATARLIGLKLTLKGSQ